VADFYLVKKISLLYGAGSLSRALLFLSAVSLFYGCNNDHTPRPIGYNRIEIEEYFYKEFTNQYFSFGYSSQAYIDTVRNEDNNDGLWFNIVYPGYKAHIYCSYSPVDRKTLKGLLEDSYHLAYSHVVKADGINTIVYNNPRHHTSGMLYEIEGNVATPFQFFLTDSISNFFRASFYYDMQVKSDSVEPVTDLIRGDIIKLMESFEWIQ